jgi:crotonobetainyl-CoA:carnitine CoA-transferase CaiB-like acyl-CoA transferase
VNGALSGVRVLDFTEYIAGPYCGQMLADMGADVTKVEPLIGDYWRLSGQIAPNESRGFIALNKGKKSMAIDLKRPEAAEIKRRMFAQADVVIQNYRPGVAERLGVDYAAASAVNSRIVYGEITGFGTKGPYAGRAGYDLVAQAMTGIMAYEGNVGMPRSINTISVTDVASGMFIAFSVATALYQRELTGHGQRIETDLFAAGIALQYRPLLSVEATDRAARDTLIADLQRGREQGLSYEDVIGDRRPGRTPSHVGPYYRIYEARDGYMVVACLNNRLRRMVRDMLGTEDPRVDGDEFDVAGLDPEASMLLTAHMEALFSTRSVAEWCDELDRRGVPCGPIRLPAELYEDPHVVANGLIREFDHPVVGVVKMANSPVRMSEADTGASASSPALGQHTREFLTGLGFASREVDAWEASGVVRTWSES